MRPNFFSSLGLLAPYFTLYDETLFDSYRGLLGTALDTLMPTWKLITFPTRGRQPEYTWHFIKDPRGFSRGKMAVRNM